MGFDKTISSLYLANIPIHILIRRSPLIWAFMISDYRSKTLISEDINKSLTERELDKLCFLSYKRSLLSNFLTIEDEHDLYFHNLPSSWLQCWLSNNSRSVPILKYEDTHHQIDKLEPNNDQIFKLYLLRFLYDHREYNDVKFTD